MKKIKILLLILILASLFINFIPLKETKGQTTKTAIFRPFYPGYQKGTVQIFPNQWYPSENRGITREWNLEGWNITSFMFVMRFALFPQDYGFPPTNIYYFPDITLSFSFDNGTTWPETRILEGCAYEIDLNQKWGYSSFPPGDILYCELNWYFDPNDAKNLFKPTTMIRFKYTLSLIDHLTLCNVYWGKEQKPVPPYDYRDEYGTYVQYYILSYVEYTEEQIEYKGQIMSFNLTETKRRLKMAGETILSCQHPSGAINEVVGKQFGKETWIVIYSSQLATINLIDLCKIFPENAPTYLLAAKRFIVWMWNKQWDDGSFPFILTDGDQHCWYNETADLWYGYDKIDSFSALAITLMAKYYNATQDINFINQYWNQIEKCRQFLYNLVNTTYWLPRDGYHYENETGYTISQWSLLHDSCEVYQAFKDLSYLYNVRGNSSDASYWSTFADSIANGIRTYFWNETNHRYSGFYNLETQKQDPTRVYSTITPIIYNIETNKTRALLTIQNYLSWGILTGRYYEKKWAADYSIYNEYSTMSGMIISAFHKLNTKWNYIAKWMKDKLIEITKFLFMNPIYPYRDLQTSNGFLDWVNLVNYTWAKDYARLVETNGWIINGFLNLNYGLYIFNNIEKQQEYEYLKEQDQYWENKTKTFQAETGYVWNEGNGYSRWIQWLKENQLYVEWYDYLFLKHIFDYLDEGMWWEEEPPHYWPEFPNWPEHDIFTIRFPNLVLPLMGSFGLILLIGSPYYIIKKMKEGEYIKGLGWGVIMFTISIGLIVAWLWP